MKTLPVFVSLVFVSLVFAVDGFAQTPAQGPMQVAQAAGGASQGAVATGTTGHGRGAGCCGGGSGLFQHDYALAPLGRATPPREPGSALALWPRTSHKAFPRLPRCSRRTHYTTELAGQKIAAWIFPEEFFDDDPECQR